MGNRVYKINILEYLYLIFALIGLIFFFGETSLDIYLIKFFYSVQTHSWPYQKLYITQEILHKGGLKLNVFLLTTCLISIIYFSFRKNRKYILMSVHLFLSVVISISIVAFLKSINPILCPWDLKYFGGTSDYVSLFNFFSFNLKPGHCFPGGHSSGAFSWIAVYFSYYLVTGIRKHALILPGIGLGLIYGITQQIRGAHFFSHDIASLLICWTVSGGLAYLFYLKFSKKNRMGIRT